MVTIYSGVPENAQKRVAIQPNGCRAWVGSTEFGRECNGPTVAVSPSRFPSRVVRVCTECGHTRSND